MNKPYYCGECLNLYYDEKEHMFWCDIINREPEITPWYQPEDCPYYNNKYLYNIENEISINYYPWCRKKLNSHEVDFSILNR